MSSKASAPKRYLTRSHLMIQMAKQARTIEVDSSPVIAETQENSFLSESVLGCVDSFLMNSENGSESFFIADPLCDSDSEENSNAFYDKTAENATNLENFNVDDDLNLSNIDERSVNESGPTGSPENEPIPTKNIKYKKDFMANRRMMGELYNKQDGSLGRVRKLKLKIGLQFQAIEIPKHPSRK
jgi:hypothetical protein